MRSLSQTLFFFFFCFMYIWFHSENSKTVWQVEGEDTTTKHKSPKAVFPHSWEVLSPAQTYWLFDFLELKLDWKPSIKGHCFQNGVLQVRRKEGSQQWLQQVVGGGEGGSDRRGFCGSASVRKCDFIYFCWLCPSPLELVGLQLPLHGCEAVCGLVFLFGDFMGPSRGGGSSKKIRFIPSGFSKLFSCKEMSFRFSTSFGMYQTGIREFHLVINFMIFILQRNEPQHFTLILTVSCSQV